MIFPSWKLSEASWALNSGCGLRRSACSRTQLGVVISLGGLCGVESLDEAARPPPPVGEGIQVTPQQVSAPIAAFAPAQVLNRATRAVHAAGFWRPDEGLVALREDVSSEPGAIRRFQNDDQRLRPCWPAELTENVEFPVSACEGPSQSPGIPGLLPGDRRLPEYQECVAGAGGFEPPYGGIKIATQR
jgi:hypothetical protein